jgi:hypothetical protein
MDEMKGGKEKKKDHCRTISKFKLQNHRKRHNRQSITHKHMDAHTNTWTLTQAHGRSHKHMNAHTNTWTLTQTHGRSLV